jgi:hypothetical protein
VLFYPPDPGWSNGRIRIRDKTSRIRNTDPIRVIVEWFRILGSIKLEIYTSRSSVQTDLSGCYNDMYRYHFWAGLWIRIDLIRIWIQHFCSIRIRIQAKTELSKTNFLL